METKKEIRTRALKERGALPPETRAFYDQKIHRLAAAHPLFQNAREIYCYASFRDEVSTAGLIELAWQKGKKVAVPRVAEGMRMEFCYIESLTELRPGYQGIPEPAAGISGIQDALGRGAADNISGKALPVRAGGREELHEKDGRDILVILPGAAFDRKGNRIGYGKGFYDRYLQHFHRCRRMGLAYSVQCVEEIPAQAWDICAEAVITEKGNFVTCGMNYQKIR